jgi:serine/threonine protein kinase
MWYVRVELLARANYYYYYIVSFYVIKTLIFLIITSLILYEMLYGKTPWQGKSPNDLLDKIEKFEVRFPDVPIVGEPLKRLLSAMLRREEKDRLSWEEIFENAHFTEQTKQAQHNIEESLKSIELFCKNDKLVQAKALNRLYYENNRVITSAYECAKRDRINKIMLSNQEQGGGGVQPFQEELSGMDEELQSHTQVGGGGSNLY